MDFNYSNVNSYDFSSGSNFENGSNVENGSDSGCSLSVDVNSDYANSPYPNSPFASSGIFSSSSLAAYASASFANYMSSDRATFAERFGCIEEEEESEDELIIVDDDVTAMSQDFNHVVNEVVQDQPEIQPEPQPEPQLDPMDVETDGLVRDLTGVDISGHQASRVIVSNMAAARHHCDLCGQDVENLDDHFGFCPAELNLGPDIDQVFDARDFLDHLMANEPRVEPPPIATRYIPGNHINNMEYLLNCMTKERTGMLRNN